MSTQQPPLLSPVALARLTELGRLPFDILGELVRGFRAGTLPLLRCAGVGTALAILLMLRLDTTLAQAVPWWPHRPKNVWAVSCYLFGLETSPFWIWAMWRVALKRQLLRRLRDIFIAAGLKNALGHFPGFIFDRPLDQESRLLRLSRSLLPKEKFESARSVLESGLQVFIDEMRDNREAGTIDIIYAHRPMPSLTSLPPLEELETAGFIVGMARARTIKATLKDVPHLLVAGETSSGKSTYLRQFITSLYVGNPDYEFTLIDLKAGLEFSLFKDLKRVAVMASLSEAVPCLADLDRELDHRMKLFQTHGTKDIDAYSQKRAHPKSDTLQRETMPKLSRHILVIDEIAELFLAGADRPVKDIQRARAIVSRLSRQGRAVGFHLVLGTQRPDARALDTQIKANLAGKVCFQMADIASSMVVLGSSRARELPGIPGRAVWQRGLQMIEVQTPYLDPAEAETLLAPFKVAENKATKAQATDGQMTRS